MGILQKIFGTAVGETVKGIGEGVSTLAMGLRSAITGDLPPEKQAELQKLAMEAESLGNRSQAEINKIEASSKSLFIAGWRPAVGWTCVVALWLHYIIMPVANWAAVMWTEGFTPPKLDLSDLIILLGGLLGLGYMRTVEKKNGVQGRH